MMDKTDSLLLRLRSYRPKPGRDSLEDFVTEAFAWLLQQSPEVATTVLGLVYRSLPVEMPTEVDVEELEWVTQSVVGGKRPDMVCHLGEDVLVFEHKVWAGLADEQLVNYGEAANAKWPGKNVRLITITAHAGQFSETAHVKLLWQDIHQEISKLADSSGSFGDHHVHFYIRDFLALLTFEGLGPSKPVSIASVRCYRTGKALESQILDLFNSIESAEWDLPDEYDVHVRNRDGRHGLQFYRKDHKPEWSPGIFAGCMLDGSDHRVQHRSQPLVDFRVILSFARPLHGRYPDMASYKAIKRHLDQRLREDDWTFYDHRRDPEVRSPNQWHPLHLERSFLDLIRGADTLQAQANEVHAVVNEALGLFQAEGHLKRLMEECDLALTGPRS